MSGAGEGAATPSSLPSPPFCPSPGLPGAGSPPGRPRRSRSCGSCTGSTRRWKVLRVSGVSVGPPGGGKGSVPAFSLSHRWGHHRCHPGPPPHARADAEAGGEAAGEDGAGQQCQGLPAGEVGQGPLGTGQGLTSSQGRDPQPFPTPRKGTNIVLWTEEQEEELTRLFEEFQASDGELDTGGRPLKTPCSPRR